VWIELRSDNELVARQVLPLFESPVKAAIAASVIRSILVAITAGMSGEELESVLSSTVGALQNMGTWLTTNDQISPQTFCVIAEGRYSYSFVDNAISSLIVGEYGAYAEAQELDARDIESRGSG
jgi:hypothetical protein